MCNIDCVPKTWSLSLKNYAQLDGFCKKNSLSEEDFIWLMEFCTRESLDFEHLCNLFDFYDLYKNKCYMNLENRKNDFKEKLYLKFKDKKFIISGRIKSFLRVIKKIDKKNSDALNDNKLSWNDITAFYDKFEESINKYVKDFYGVRVIPVPYFSEFSIENLNYTLNTLSPQDFLLKLFIPTTKYYDFCDNGILYSIKDFFDDEFEIRSYKDFLKFPKSNGYRSLQFCCIFDKDKSEIQVRNFLHHIYAEYEHRRYEGKLQFSEFIPFYLSCEICSNYFASDEIKKFDFSKIALMYFVCLSILTNDEMSFKELYNEIDNCVHDYNYDGYVLVDNNLIHDGLYSFNNLYNSDDKFINICSHIILSVRDNIIKDSQKFCSVIKNQIILEMSALDESYVKNHIMNILSNDMSIDNHKLCYKINNK